MVVIKVYSKFGSVEAEPLQVVDIHKKISSISSDELKEEYKEQASVGDEAQVPAEDASLNP